MSRFRPSSLLSGYVWAVVLALRWTQLQLLEPVATWWLDTVLAAVEESIKAFMRELVANSTRAVNGFSNAMAALLLDRQAFRKNVSGRRRQVAAWRRWWRAHDRGKTGTFNAILARDGFVEPSLPSGRGGGLRRRPQDRRGLQSDGHSGSGSAWLRVCQLGKRAWSTQAERLPSGFAPFQGGKPLSREDSLAQGVGTGSDLFIRPAGAVASAGVPRRGFLEETRLAVEVFVSRMFAWTRRLTRRLLMLPEPDGAPADLSRVPSFDGWLPRLGRPAARERSVPFNGRLSPSRPRLPKAQPINTAEDLRHWTVSDVIIRAGYPLETHIATTTDGYILTMQRIPRKAARDVVFFQHGILDTSLTWVSNGTEGSQAFAAYDAGFDVWLGNSRSNPPRAHKDPKMMGMHYWNFSINELGIQDMDAQMDLIHRIKTAELSRLGRHGALLGDVAPRVEAGLLKYSQVANIGHLPQAAAVEASGTDLGKLLGGTPGGGASSLGAGEAESARQRLALPLPAEPLARPLRRTGSDSILTARRNLEHDAIYGESSSGTGSDAGISDDGESASEAPEPVTPRAAMARRAASVAATSPDGRAMSCLGSLPALSPGRAATPRPGARAPTAHEGRPSTPRWSNSLLADPMQRAGQAYRLQAVGHSLGGASLLLYAVHRRALGKPHRLSRLVLLSPAGFHSHCPRAAWIFLKVLPSFMLLLTWLRPGASCPVYIPSSLLRYVAFKLTLDIQELPALQELFKAALRTLMSGDNSEWDRALQMPHYNEYSMPALSLHAGAHLVQLINSRRWRLYDYGTRFRNRTVYGSPVPPEVSDFYDLLRGLPVDMIAGRYDGVVNPGDVRRHCEALRAAGVKTTFRQFDVGHLDLVFAMHDDIHHYVLSRLLVPPSDQVPRDWRAAAGDSQGDDPQCDAQGDGPQCDAQGDGPQCDAQGDAPADLRPLASLGHA